MKEVVLEMHRVVEQW